MTPHSWPCSTDSSVMCCPLWNLGRSGRGRGREGTGVERMGEGGEGRGREREGRGEEGQRTQFLKSL